MTKKRRRPIHLHVMVSEEEQALIQQLVYGNVQQGDDLVKGVQARMLAPVLKIHDGTRGTIYELCKVFLCPAFGFSFALDLPA